MLSPIPVGRRVGSSSKKHGLPTTVSRTESFIVSLRQDWWGHTLLVLITAVSIGALIFVTAFMIYLVIHEVVGKMHDQQDLRGMPHSV
eukprot:scaffold630_cov188-Ochromonas_danica.AAC.21